MLSRLKRRPGENHFVVLKRITFSNGRKRWKFLCWVKRDRLSCW